MNDRRRGRSVALLHRSGYKSQNINEQFLQLLVDHSREGSGDISMEPA